ncbi:MAG: ATP-grasp domain-containing protein [Phycisphaeraceae bacterium]|nr:ATP-grasp domain-containing protein [Phycisphaeraceae bacterium]
MSRELIILGASTRAAAQSAIRAGFHPWCIDLFADRDLQSIAPVVRCPPDQYPAGMLPLLESAPQAPVLCTGAMENYPEIIDAIARHRPLMGCSADVITAVRDPHALASLPALEGIRFCSVFDATTPKPPVKNTPRGQPGEPQYLLKPHKSAGGVNIKPWLPTESIPVGYFVQEYVQGKPMSAIYHADNRGTVLLGVTEQFIGDADFGGRGFHYCGGIGPLQLSADAMTALDRLGTLLTEHFRLRGIVGVDLVMDVQGLIRPVEINPRYTASVELLERATGMTALSDHPNSPPADDTHTLCAKAIIFAKSDSVIPDLYKIFPRDTVADVSMPGEKVQAGRPICTLFAAGETRWECVTKLRQEAAKLYTQLETQS